MPTRITQIEKPESKAPLLEVIGQNGDQPDSSDTESVVIDSGSLATVFKVEGTLYLRDAELLETICRCR